jgi:hypothetical protein
MRVFAVALSALCITASAASAEPSNNRSFVVFFEGSSVSLTPEAQKIVKAAAAKARSEKVSYVMVAGPRTRIVPGYNPAVADPRVALVQNELIANGVRKNKLAHAAVTTDDVKVPLDGAQRVEIRIVPKSNENDT